MKPLTVQEAYEWGQWMLEEDRIAHWSQEVHRRNPWFIPEFTENMIRSIGEHYLSREQLEDWLGNYSFRENQSAHVGLICAGNIPGVGFHDLLCILCSPHNGQIKLSGKDDYLLPALMEFFKTKNPEVYDRITWVEKLSDFDAVIATGANRTLPFFQQYFGHVPHIFRGHRNGVAVLTGNESDDEIKALADDIFLYFGLGCRNVSMIWIPKNMDVKPLLMAWENEYDFLVQNHKYMNNYDYNKALLLMNKEDHLSSANLHLVENDSLLSRISVLHKMEYENLDQVKDWIRAHEDGIQCVMAKEMIGDYSVVPPGYAQRPRLNDYADATDTMYFLQNL